MKKQKFPSKNSRYGRYEIMPNVVQINTLPLIQKQCVNVKVLKWNACQ